MPIVDKANGSSSSTPTSTDALQDKTEPNSHKQSSNESSKAKGITTPTTDSSGVVLLKGKDGSIVAKGTVLPGHNTIHGHPCKDDCHVVAVTDIVQVGAQPWFEDRFDEGLSKGGFVEWPKECMQTN